jgi:hypothetical protein
VLLAGAGTTLAAGLALLQATVGLRNYYFWTVTFAGRQRLPGVGEMVAVYREPSLLWVLPSVAVGAALLRSRWAAGVWVRVLAVGLLAAPFVPPVVSLLRTPDADDHASSLLALWPPLLVLAIALTLWRAWQALRGRGDRADWLLPLALLAAVHGTLLSQQLWGSTYAIWPLFVLLLAELLAALDSSLAERAGGSVATSAAVVGGVLLLCGGFYTFSEDRLSYAQVSDGPLVRASAPALAGMTVRGPYLPAFEQLLDFAAREIPRDDALLLLPGEDPFYYATGRTPRFPVLLFDQTCDPYSPEELVRQVQSRNVRWLIVKQRLQLTSQVLPEPERTMAALLREFTLYRRLDGYEVYRRR